MTGRPSRAACVVAAGESQALQFSATASSATTMLQPVAHAISRLALLLIRIAEREAHQTWRRIALELPVNCVTRREPALMELAERLAYRRCGSPREIAKPCPVALRPFAARYSK